LVIEAQLKTMQHDIPKLKTFDVEAFSRQNINAPQFFKQSRGQRNKGLGT